MKKMEKWKVGGETEKYGGFLQEWEATELREEFNDSSYARHLRIGLNFSLEDLDIVRKELV